MPKEKHLKNCGIFPSGRKFPGNRSNELNNEICSFDEVAKRFRLEMDFVIGEIIKNSANLIVIKSAKEHIGQLYQQSREIANPDVKSRYLMILYFAYGFDG